MPRLLISSLLTLYFGLNGQSDSLSVSQDPSSVERLSIFIDAIRPYCTFSHHEFLIKHFNQPKTAPAKFKARFEVIITVAVDSTVEQIKIVDKGNKDINPLTKEPYGYVKEIERVMHLFKAEKWIAGRENGKAVRSKMSFDVNFGME